MKILSDVIGAEALHDFNYTIRPWAYMVRNDLIGFLLFQFHRGFNARQHYHTGLQPAKLPRYTPLYTTAGQAKLKSESEPRAFETYTIHQSKFARREVVPSSE